MFRVSVLIRNATPRDRYARAEKRGEPLDPHFDISHVGQKFPIIHRTVWLERRLGEAITRRRRFLGYCRKHHDALASREEVIKSTEEADEVEYDESKSKGRSTFAPTAASTLVLSRLKNTSTDALVDEAKSQTSYATSVGDDQGDNALRVPNIPVEAADGQHFECPYCWSIQKFETRNSWK